MNNIPLYHAHLIQTRLLLQARRADGVEQAQYSHTVRFGSVLRHLKGHLHVRHRAQVVDLVRLNLCVCVFSYVYCRVMVVQVNQLAGKCVTLECVYCNIGALLFEPTIWWVPA